MSTRRLLELIIIGKRQAINPLAAEIDGNGAASNPKPTTTLTYASSLTIPVVSDDRTFQLTLTGNCNLNIADGAFDGQTLRIALNQDATGSRLVTLSSKFRFSSSAPSSAFILSTNANTKDVFAIAWDATASKWDMLSFMKGFN